MLKSYSHVVLLLKDLQCKVLGPPPSPPPPKKKHLAFVFFLLLYASVEPQQTIHVYFLNT